MEKLSRYAAIEAEIDGGHMKTVLVLAILVVVMVGSPFRVAGDDSGRASEVMDYHDYAESIAVLDTLANSSNVRVETIGISTDFTKAPPVAYPIRAIRISAPPTSGGTKPGSVNKASPKNRDELRPAVLFDGGIHAREWLTSESAIELAKYLVEESRLPNSRASQALNRVDVWIIPMTNPSGRVLDDPHGGNPLEAKKDAAEKDGWRGNGDARTNPHGIDVHRNFSHDWGKAPADPKDKHWRGPAPFFAQEAATLRQFVQNHPIAMAVHLHSNSQDICSVWDDRDKAGLVMRRRAAEEWLKGCGRFANQIARPLDDMKLELDEQRMGASIGQYTGWMTYPSDTPDQPDFGTLRGIQTFLVELPFDNFKRGNYYGKDFQYQSKDGTNSFHPSGAKTRALIREAFIPMALYLIEQAAAPCCATRVEGGRLVPETASQRTADVGLMAATIGQSAESGSFTTWPAVETTQGQTTVMTPAYDSVPDGKQMVYFLVQNYGSKAADAAVDILVEHRESGRSANWTSASRITKRFTAIPSLGHRSGEAPLTVVVGREYRVSIDVATKGDPFPLNDRKVFRFVGQATTDNDAKRSK